MTYQSYLTLLDQAAFAAAEASMDAHDRQVPAHIAWDFISQVHQDEPEVYAFMDRLPKSMPGGFAHAYAMAFSALRVNQDQSCVTD